MDNFFFEFFEEILLMNFYTHHEAKSKYSYMYDKDTLHLRLLVQEGIANSVKVIYGDPFMWGHHIELDNQWAWQKDKASPSLMLKEATLNGLDHFFVSLKPSVRRIKYAFIINEQFLVSTRGLIDIKDNPHSQENLFYYFNFPYLNQEDVFSAPSWVKDQVWYSIFPERFMNGDKSLSKDNILPWGQTDRYSNDQRFGGDLRGIIQKIPYLKEVGFTGIYMTPIFVSDTSHKYDIIDYYRIDPAFGDNETFKELVDIAHHNGLKVMLDAVFNHCGFRHPFFQDVIEKGVDSVYYDCFYIIDQSKPIVSSDYVIGEKFPREIQKQIHQNRDLLNYRTFAFSTSMPKMNTSHPIMKAYLLDVAAFWIKNYDIDGWRLDVSNEVGHQFWRDFRNVVKLAKKDAYIVGENWDDAYPWLQGDQYDAVMNYGFMFPIHHYFQNNNTEERMNTVSFIDQMHHVLLTYPKNVIESMYNLVDSHDTARILEICGNDFDLVKLPYVLMFSLPGAPSIYYGGEVGLSGKHDPDNRRCMLWGDFQNKEMLVFMKRLIELRKSSLEMKSPNMTFLQSDNYVLFIKKETLFIVLNNNSSPFEAVLPMEMKNKNYNDLYSDTFLSLSDKIILTKYQFLILKEV